MGAEMRYGARNGFTAHKPDKSLGLRVECQQKRWPKSYLSNLICCQGRPQTTAPEPEPGRSDQPLQY